MAPFHSLEVTLVKPYVYLLFAAFLAATACAHGEMEWPAEPDADSKPDVSKPDASPLPPAEASTGDEPQPVQDVTTTSCSPLPLGTGNPTCDTCISAGCCSEDQICGGDPNCATFINCVDGCLPADGGPPDPTCQSTCESSYPTGASELYNLDNCMSAQCRTQCIGP